MNKVCPLPQTLSPRSNDQLLWDYDCSQCGVRFSVEVPKGPTEERALRCPQCRSDHIVKLNDYNPSEAFCGG